MLGPYKTSKNQTLAYKGNKLYPPFENVFSFQFQESDVVNRVASFKQQEIWTHLSHINHRVNLSIHNYFDSIQALFIPIPLTTQMTSCAGAVYKKNPPSYTTDTPPHTIDWFHAKEATFLSESSQLYLEMALVQPNIKHVYSINNSFRKEKSNATHLTEFHHIEYEGNIDQEENETVIINLIKEVIKNLLKHEIEALTFFLSDEKIQKMSDLCDSLYTIPKISYKTALDILWKETKNDKYKNFTTENEFGFWEEVKITEIFESPVFIKNFPLSEGSFYHAKLEMSSPAVGNNADLIWPGYMEVVGSGQRVASEKELLERAETFNLPKDRYDPYLKTRALPGYKPSSGFGLGWERLLQGLLEMPFIWSSAHFPRTHLRPIP